MRAQWAILLFTFIIFILFCGIILIRYMNTNKSIDQKHPLLAKMREKRHLIMDEHIKYHNTYITPLKNEEDMLRDKLPRMIASERKEAERRIAEIKKIIEKDKKWQMLEKKNNDIDNEFFGYIRQNLTYKEKEALGFSPYDLLQNRKLFNEEEIKLYERDEKRADIFFYIFIAIIFVMLMTAGSILTVPI